MTRLDRNLAIAQRHEFIKIETRRPASTPKSRKQSEQDASRNENDMAYFCRTAIRGFFTSSILQATLESSRPIKKLDV